MSFLNPHLVSKHVSHDHLPQMPFCLRRESITTGYLMRAHSEAQDIAFPALSSCLEGPGASAVKAIKLIYMYMFYKAEYILSSDTIKR